MAFLNNTWYMLGWGNELSTSGAFVHRKIAGEPILAYRLTNGQVAAIQDRCAHRFVPLHKGRQVGDTIECGYHGLCFGADGKCVKNPVEGALIPKAAKVRAFPLVELYGALWVWLGDPSLADPGTIPDFSFLVDASRSVVAGCTLTQASADLAIDNLSDLTHVQYVHREFQASEAYPRLKVEVQQEGHCVTTRLILPGGRPPPFFTNALPESETFDLVFDARWNPPSLIKLTFRAYAPGDRTKPLLDSISAHIVSAETSSSCHYFYANARDFAVGDASVDEKVREWQRIGFSEQDKPMLEAQQTAIGDADLMSLGPVLLPTDAGSVRIRRVLKSLIDAEAAALRIRASERV